jgi:hypothetical protein
MMLTLCGIFLEGCSQNGPGHRLLIPQGYHGWLIVEIERKDLPPVPVVAGRYEYRFSPKGYVGTRDAVDERWHPVEECFYVSRRGQRLPLPRVHDYEEAKYRKSNIIAVWGGGTGSVTEVDGQNRKSAQHEYWFVGTYKEWKNIDSLPSIEDVEKAR